MAVGSQEELQTVQLVSAAARRLAVHTEAAHTEVAHTAAEVDHTAVGVDHTVVDRTAAGHTVAGFVMEAGHIHPAT